MSFMKLNREELLKAAAFYKVDVDQDATKQNITTSLLDAGKTPEQWEKDSEAWEHGLAAEEEDRGEVISTHSLSAEEVEEEDEEDLFDDELPEPTPAPAEESEEPEQMVLVRFTGNNASYKTGRWRFSANKPFALMTEEQFESLDRQKFRLATKREAAEFYGQ